MVQFTKLPNTCAHLALYVVVMSKNEALLEVLAISSEPK
jgi:hypothetical protein